MPRTPRGSMPALGFDVPSLLGKARSGGALKIGLSKLDERDWFQPRPDRAARAAAFAEFPGGIQMTSEAARPGAELAGILDITGGLAEAAASRHEDMCLLTRREGEEVYRLIGAAVAWPSDWLPCEKMGLPMRGLHAPIHGYEDQLASGVDRFMDRLKPGAIYGRSNWFIAATGAMRWVAEPPDIAFADATPANAGKTLFVRSERQTLRRLPETGAILFTIGIYVQPLGALPGASLRWLADAARAIPPGERERRGIGAYLPALIGYAESRGEESAR